MSNSSRFSNKQLGIGIGKRLPLIASLFDVDDVAEAISERMLSRFPGRDEIGSGLNTLMPLSGYKKDDLSPKELYEIEKVVSRFSEYLISIGYSYHVPSGNENTDMVLDAQQGLLRPVKAMLPGAWLHFFDEYLKATHDKSYEVFVSNHRIQAVLKRLPVTIAMTMQPVDGKHYGEFSRLVPTETAWQYKANIWKPFILKRGVNAYEPPLNFEPFGFDDDAESVALRYAKLERFRYQSIGEYLDDFFARLFPDVAQRNVVRKWFGHGLLKPSEKPAFGLLLGSEQGTGKGFLMSRFLTPLTCGQSVQVKSYSELFGTHSEVNATAIFCGIDDAVPNNRHGTAIKALITEKKTLVNKKFRDVEFVDSFARYFIAYNIGDKQIPLSDDDRRFYVVDAIGHKINRSETADFLAELSDFLDVDLHTTLTGAFHWFTEGVESFNAKKCPPDTESKLRLLDSKQLQPLEEFLASWIATHRLKLFDFSDVVSSYRFKVDNIEMSKAVEALGFVRHRIQTRIMNEYGITGRPIIYYCKQSFNSAADASRAYLETSPNIKA